MNKPPQTASSVQKALRKLDSKEKAKHSTLFFKSGPGDYGEGDKFLGVSVPSQRKVAKAHIDITLDELQKLLDSAYHEDRLTALLIMTYQYEQATKRADAKTQKALVDFYLKNTGCVNNWDLVDASAHKLLGAWLLDKPRKKLYTLAKSTNLWERRIAIISTFAFLPNDDFADAMALAEILVSDTHDLMHKAVGWVLREVGKRDKATEVRFLQEHYKTMPRTMLRYAIEKFPELERKAYLNGAI